MEILNKKKRLDAEDDDEACFGRVIAAVGDISIEDITTCILGASKSINWWTQPKKG